MSKEQAKKFLIKAKIYRIFAVIFLIGGLAFFAYVYFEKFDGDITKAVMNPMSVGFFVVSLLPALFFSWRAGVLENKMVDAIDNMNTGESKK